MKEPFFKLISKIAPFSWAHFLICFGQTNKRQRRTLTKNLFIFLATAMVLFPPPLEANDINVKVLFVSQSQEGQVTVYPQFCDGDANCMADGGEIDVNYYWEQFKPGTSEPNPDAIEIVSVNTPTDVSISSDNAGRYVRFAYLSDGYVKGKSKITDTFIGREDLIEDTTAFRMVISRAVKLSAEEQEFVLFGYSPDEIELHAALKRTEDSEDEEKLYVAALATAGSQIDHPYVTWDQPYGVLGIRIVLDADPSMGGMAKIFDSLVRMRLEPIAPDFHWFQCRNIGWCLLTERAWPDLLNLPWSTEIYGYWYEIMTGFKVNNVKFVSDELPASDVCSILLSHTLDPQYHQDIPVFCSAPINEDAYHFKAFEMSGQYQDYGYFVIDDILR